MSITTKKAIDENISKLTTMEESKNHLKIKLKYKPALAPENRETDPILHCYLSQNVSKVEPLIQIFDFKDIELQLAEKTDDKKLKSFYHGNKNSKSSSITENNNSNQWFDSIVFDRQIEMVWPAEKIDRDTTLNFDAFIHTFNNKGEKCINEAGSCSIYLYEIYYYLNLDPKKHLYLKKPLFVYNANNMFKGFVYLEIDPDMITNVVSTFATTPTELTLPPPIINVSIDSEFHPEQKPKKIAHQFVHFNDEQSGGEENDEKDTIVVQDTDDNSNTEDEDENDVDDNLIDQQNINKKSNQSVPLKTTINKLSIKDVFKESSVYDYIGPNKQLFDEIFKMYILSTYSVFNPENSEPSWAFMQDIHSPTYIFRGIVAPSICFLLLNKNPRQTNTEKYYINLLEITLRRHYKYKTLEESLEYFVKEAKDKEVAVIHAKLICVFSNYCKYMTDKAQITFLNQQNKPEIKTEFKYMNEEHDDLIDKHHNNQTEKNASINTEQDSIVDLTRKHRAQQNKQIDSYFAKEKIKIALKKYDDEYRERVSSILKNKADVLPEDSNITHAQASEINDDRNVKLIESFSLWLRMTFTGDCEDMAREIFCHDFDIRNSIFQHPGLQRLQEVRKRYVAIQTLKGVSSAAIVDDVGELSDINAHMDITLIPAYYLLILIQNFNSARPTFEKIDELFDKSVTSPEFEQRNSELEVLNCEGTGCLNPDSTPSDSEMCKDYLEKDSNGAFADLRAMIHQELNRNSSFYKTVQSGLTNDLMKYGIGEIVFFRRPPGFNNSDNNESSKTTIPETITTTSLAENSNFSFQNDIDEQENYVQQQENYNNDDDNNEIAIESEIANNTLNPVYEAVKEHYSVAAPAISTKSTTLSNSNNNNNNVNEKLKSFYNELDAEIAKYLSKQNNSVKESLEKNNQEEQHEHFDDYHKSHQETGKQIILIASKVLSHYYSANKKMKNPKRKKIQKHGSKNNRIGDSMSSITKPTFGIPHTDLINKNTKDVMIYTMPAITKDELRRFEKVLQHNHPVPSMNGPRFSASQWPASRKYIGNILLEKICAVARMQRRKFDFITSFIHVDFYVRDDQITEERCEKIIQQVKEKKYLLNVEYYPERLTDEYGGYLLRFICAPVRAY